MLQAHIITFLLLLSVGGILAQTHLTILGSDDRFASIEEDMINEQWEEASIKLSEIQVDSTDDDGMLQVNFYLGMIADHVGASDEATTYFEQAISVLDRSSQISTARVLDHMAERELLRSQYEKAEYYSQKVLSSPDSHDSTKANALERIGHILTNQQKRGSLGFLLESLVLREHLGDEKGSLRLLNEISTIYHQRGALDSAEYYFSKSIEIKTALGDTLGLISDLTSSGKLNKERGDFAEAQADLLNAFDLAVAMKDTFSMISLRSDLGDILLEQRLDNNALEYYQQALELSTRERYRFHRARILRKLASLKGTDEKTAISYLEEALSIYEQLNNKAGEAETLILLSEFYQQSYNASKAKLLLEKALEERIDEKDKLGELKIRAALAHVEGVLGNYQNSRSLALTCEEGFTAVGDRNGLRKLYSTLSNANEGLGNFNEALTYMKKERILSDSLVSVEQTEMINRLTLQFETQKKDKELAEQKAEIESQKGEIQQRNFQMLLLLVGLALIFGLLGFFIFRNRKNDQLARERIKVLESEKEAEALKAMIDGEEKERQRLSQELHDGLGAVLATVKMEISGIKYKSPDIEDNPNYQKAEELIDDACRTVREISHDLMPHVLEQQGLEFAIEDLCQSLSQNSETQFEFIFFGDEKRLSATKSISLFRITQELLKNVLKHASAKEVIVQLTIEDEVMLVVEDDGVGFDMAASFKGIGLKNIRNRVDLIQGQLEIESNKGEGSTFTITTGIDNTKHD